MPPAYFIPLAPLNLNDWQWCIVGEVCAYARKIALQLHGADFDPTPNDLISRFALLVTPNKIETRRRKQKLFRYSLDGRALRSIEVPPGDRGRSPIEVAITPETYIPSGLAKDILRLSIRGGAWVGQWTNMFVAFGHDGQGIEWAQNRLIA